MVTVDRDKKFWDWIMMINNDEEVIFRAGVWENLSKIHKAWTEFRNKYLDENT